jgi:hypothetical protein
MSATVKEIVGVLTFGDKLLIAFLTLASIGSFWILGMSSAAGGYAIVSTAGQPQLRKSLQEDGVLTVRGPLGATSIEIARGAIHISDSPCPQKLCLRQGWIHRVGEIIVCVPNRVSIWIEGQRTNPFDAITG